MPTPIIRKAERAQSKLRIGLAGPSGAGKTMSALKLARGIVGPSGRILMIDTERGSGDLYSHLTDYDIITLTPPYAPKNYVEAIEAAEDAGYDVIIIDSLSHAWTDEGGLLDQADKLSKGGNRFTVWADLTPQHRKLVNGMLNADTHIIATIRSKQEYAMEKDEKTGKSQVRKLGLAPVQREGMEYEFTVFFDIEQTHAAKTSKDRTDLFKDEVFTIDETIGDRLVKWLMEAKRVTADAPSNAAQRAAQREADAKTRAAKIEQEKLQKKQRIMTMLKMLDDKITKDSPVDVIIGSVYNITKLDLEEANYDEIIDRLRVCVKEKTEASNH